MYANDEIMFQRKDFMMLEDRPSKNVKTNENTPTTKAFESIRFSEAHNFFLTFNMSSLLLLHQFLTAKPLISSKKQLRKEINCHLLGTNNSNVYFGHI